MILFFSHNVKLFFDFFLTFLKKSKQKTLMPNFINLILFLNTRKFFLQSIEEKILKKSLAKTFNLSLVR